jgi:hypothetical protein
MVRTALAMAQTLGNFWSQNLSDRVKSSSPRTSQEYADLAFHNLVTMVRFFGLQSEDNLFYIQREVETWHTLVESTHPPGIRPQAAGKYFDLLILLLKMKQASGGPSSPPRMCICKNSFCFLTGLIMLLCSARRLFYSTRKANFGTSKSFCFLWTRSISNLK